MQHINNDNYLDKWQLLVKNNFEKSFRKIVYAE